MMTTDSVPQGGHLSRYRDVHQVFRHQRSAGFWLQNLLSPRGEGGRKFAEPPLTGMCGGVTKHDRK